MIIAKNKNGINLEELEGMSHEEISDYLINYPEVIGVIPVVDYKIIETDLGVKCLLEDSEGNRYTYISTQLAFHFGYSEDFKDGFICNGISFMYYDDPKFKYVMDDLKSQGVYLLYNNIDITQ